MKFDPWPVEQRGKIMKLENYSDEELKRELERRELNIPETVRFTHYLHDQYSLGEWAEIMEDRTDIGFSDEILQKARGKFYELAVDCEMDTRTGEITILGVN